MLSWALLHEGFYERDQIVDTPIYERYGRAMADGQMPYRDFAVEYPPAALPVFRAPVEGGGAYDAKFEGLMAALGVAVVLLVASIAASWWAPFFVAVSPLLLGSVVLSRFDLWPAALTAMALAVFLAGTARLGLAVLGVAAAAKVYPALLAPLLLAHVGRTHGRREMLLCAGAFLAAVVAVVLPFAVLSPDGVWDGFWGQAGRPLQIESLGAGFLLAAHHVFGLDLTMESSHGSQNLAGGGADALAVISTLVQVAAVVAGWVWYARGPADIPLVPLVRGRRGLLASGVLAVALVATQLWFPYRYWELALEFDTAASWLVLLRDLTLVALLAVLTLRAPAARARTA